MDHSTLGPSGNVEPNGAVGGDLPRAWPLIRVPGSAANELEARRLNPHGMKSTWHHKSSMSSYKLHKGNEMATAAAEMELALR